MDIDDLTTGQRFDQEIQRALDQSNVCLVVIGPNWLSILRDRQQRNERDFVREEIASALRRRMLIIPMTVDGTSLPPADELPEDIRALAYHVKHDVSYARFGRDIDELRAAIRKELRKRRSSRDGLWRYFLGLALLLLIGLAIAIARHGIPPPDETAKMEKPTLESSVTADRCSERVTFACLRAGLVRGHVLSDLEQTRCTEERTYSPAELDWRSIWTTSVYSYAPGGGGPGGGLEDDQLKVGGWGDAYHTLIHFETPRLSRPVRFAAVLLFAKAEEWAPTAMHLDRISRAWSWKAGDRLWWKDKPGATFVASMPQPALDSWYFIEITQILENWRLGAVANHGLQIRPAANDRNLNVFHSTRSADLAKRPRLLVCI